MTDELTERVARAIQTEAGRNGHHIPLDLNYILARAAIEAYEAAPQPAPDWKTAAEQAKEAADKVTADARVHPADLKKPYRAAPQPALKQPEPPK